MNLRLHDPGPGKWLEEALWQWGRNRPPKVGSWVPSGYETYIRILHPARRSVNRRSKPVRWGEVARWSGRKIHTSVSFSELSTPLPEAGLGPRPWNEPPYEDGMSKEETLELAGVLADFTDTPETCWFAMWDGYGVLQMPLQEGPEKIHLTARDYRLFEGSLREISSFQFGSFYQPPNIWWPDDRAWCVSSEIDLDTTLVGASRQCIDRILQSDFETIEVGIEDPLPIMLVPNSERG